MRPRKPAIRVRGCGTGRVAPWIGWRGSELRWRVGSGGGRWDPVRRIWMVRRDAAERIDLLTRVAVGGGLMWMLVPGRTIRGLDRRCLDVGTAWLTVPRFRNRGVEYKVPRCGYLAPRFRNRCLDLGTACPVKQTVR